MANYRIYSETEFESVYGLIKKGDELDTIWFDSEQECREWCTHQYVLDGISVSYQKIGDSRRKKIRIVGECI